MPGRSGESERVQSLAGERPSRVLQGGGLQGSGAFG